MYAAALLDGLVGWMSRKGFGALAEVRGLLAVPSEATSRRGSGPDMSRPCGPPT